jgi:hypothetical protein
MNRAIARTFSFHNSYRVFIAYALLGSSIFLALLYSFNLYSIISDTVAVQHLRQQTALLSTAVEELDSEYLKLSSNITPDRLEAYGLSQGKVSLFIPRTSSLGRVSGNIR